MIPTFPWSLAGAIIGVILGSNPVSHERRPLGSVVGVLLGICGGILYQAYERDQEGAAIGASLRRAARDGPRAGAVADPDRIVAPAAEDVRGVRSGGRETERNRR